jgi:xylulokinase
MATKFVLAHDIGTTDSSDASLMLLYDIVEHKWSEEIMNELSVPMSVLPDVLKSTDIQGYITKEAAEATGLLEGTPAIVGGGDGVCATVGSSWVALHDDKPMFDRGMRFFSCVV